jgi:hypothetical protein
MTAGLHIIVNTLELRNSSAQAVGIFLTYTHQRVQRRTFCTVDLDGGTLR